MKHQEDYFFGAKNANTYYQAWLPEGEPKAILMIVHGLAEHGGRYTNLVEYIVPRGVAAYAIDQYGHGKSDGDRVFVEQFEDFIATLKIFYDKIKDIHPDKPIFMLGHSMGGLVAADYLLHYQDELKGAILSAPLSQVPENVNAFTVFMAKILSSLLPKLGMVGVESSGISRDPAEVERYVNDPLVYTGKSTARLGAEMLKAMIRLGGEASKITLPVLIIHGDADILVPPQASKELFEAISSEDKTLNLYEGHYHELHNDYDKEKVLEDVATWLEAHL